MAVTTGADAPGRQTHVPGDGHMWVMVLGDLVIFGAYFVIYTTYRAMHPSQFLESQQHLDLDAGVLNTLVLLTSSWFIACSVQAARAGALGRALQLTYLGGFSGVLFLVIKGHEWAEQIARGNTVTSSEFFTFYYMLTGVHAFHVLLGLVILGIVVRDVRDPRRRRTSMIESGATYWHMVDLLWVVIFGLFYVMR